MKSPISDILFLKKREKYKEIEDIAIQFAAAYSGIQLIREDIFSVIENYGRKKGLELQTMRFPFNDDELWAFTFLKRGVLFICINTGLSLSKQLFAATHELYHIYCFAEDINQNCIRKGSLLSGETLEFSDNDEEAEANAFAGLLLLPAQVLRNRIDVLGINSKNITVNEILQLMELCGLPYKATILRLYECGIISKPRALELYDMPQAKIDERVSLTGKAKRWTVNGRGTEAFGTLLDDFAYNKEHEFLTDNRQKEDGEYIQALAEAYKLN